MESHRVLSWQGMCEAIRLAGLVGWIAILPAFVQAEVAAAPRGPEAGPQAQVRTGAKKAVDARSAANETAGNVSAGQGTVVVPRLFGRTASGARECVAERGLVAKFRLGMTAPADALTHRVYLQVPGPGVACRSGEEVWITIHNRPSADGSMAAADRNTAGRLVAVVTGVRGVRRFESVEPRSGSAILLHTDLCVAAGHLQLEIRRSHEVPPREDRALGRGWRLNWEKRLLIQGPLATIDGESGEAVFRRETDGEYRTAAGQVLRQDHDGQWVRRLLDGTWEVYDSRGRFVAREDPNGNCIKLAYDARNRLERIAGPFGASLRFTFDQAGRLTRVDGSSGDSVHYFYGGQQLPEMPGTTSLQLRYNGEGRIARIDEVGRAPVLIHYDDRQRVVRMGPALADAWYFAYDRQTTASRCVAPSGQVTSYAWDHPGRTCTITEPGAVATTTTYDAAARPLEVVDAAGRKTRVAYDDAGRPVEITSPDATTRIEYLRAMQWTRRVTTAGVRTEYEYDDRLNLVKVRRGDQTLFEATYNKWGQVSSRGMLGRASESFEYDAAGRLIVRRDAMGAESRFEYDDRGNLVRRVNAIHQEERWAYDGAGRVMKHVAPDGAEIAFRYDRLGRLTETVRSPGGRTTLHYDAAGRLTARVAPGNAKEAFAYDVAGRLALVERADGSSVRYRYDEAGQLLRAEFGDGGAWEYTYDDLGRPTTEKGPEGWQRRYEYDSAGRVAASEDAVGRVTRYGYRADGRLESWTDPAGRRQRFEYDAQGQLCATIDPLGRRLALTRDQAGRILAASRGDRRLVAIEHQRGFVHRVSTDDSTSAEFTCDAAGRTVGLRHASGEQYRYARDPLGQVRSVTDPLGRTWSATHSPLGRLASIAGPSGDRFQYVYAAEGGLERIVAPLGRVRRFLVDAAGRCTGETDPLERTTRWTRGPGGNLATWTGPDGKTARFIYDLLGRLVRIEHPDLASVEFAYDKAGNLVRQRCDPFLATYEYDALDRIVAARFAPAGKTLRHAYDEAGRRVKLEIEGLGVWRYAYDEADRPVAVKMPGGGTVRIEYDRAGRMAACLLPGGTRSERRYDARGRLTRLKALSAQGKQLIEREYRYDSAGNLVHEAREGGSRFDYGYDVQGWLTRLESGGKRVEFGYDAVGNLFPSQGARYDVADQLLRFGDAHFQYNRHGSLAERRSGGNVTRYEYDAGQRLVRVLADERVVVEYGYDPQGRRFSRRAGGETTYTVYDEDRPLVEVAAGGRVQLAWTSAPVDGFQLALHADGRTLFPVQDMVGTVLAVVDDRGRVAGRFEFSPFGTLQQASGGLRLGSDVPLGFAGKRFDPLTGFYDFGLRWYAADLGRFLTADPAAGRLSNPASLHRYQYCYNNPLRYRDPRGATADDIADGLVELAGGVGNDVGYYTGYATASIVSLPLRVYHYATGQPQKNQQLDRAIEEFSTHVTATTVDVVAATATSLVTEPLRLGTGVGEASVDAAQGNYGRAGLNVLADVGRTAQLIRSASVASDTIKTVSDAINRIPSPAGPSSSQIRNAYLAEANNPTFRNAAQQYAGRHGLQMDWQQFMNRLYQGRFPELSGLETLRTGGGYASAGPGGQWVLGANPHLANAPILGPQSLRHELLHCVQDTLFQAFEHERTIGFWGRQSWELAASYYGDPLIKGPLIVGEFAAVGATMETVRAAQETLADRAADAMDRGRSDPGSLSAWNAVRDLLTGERPPTSETRGVDGPPSPPAAAQAMLDRFFQDVMTPEQYQQWTANRDRIQAEQLNQLINDTVRQHAQTLDRRLADAETETQRAQADYQRLQQQQAGAEQIRQAYNHWQRQQAAWQAMQQFNQAIRHQGPTTTRTPSGGTTGTHGSQNVRKGTRRTQAQGFEDLLRPITDPRLDRQVRETFGKPGTKKK